MYASLLVVVACTLFIAGCSAQSNGDLRLAGAGSTDTQGRVEVFLNEAWGTVSYSESYYVSDEANTVCRQLGYSIALNYELATVTFGKGSGHVWMENVDCSSYSAYYYNYNHLQRCTYDQPSTDDHSNDLAVYCSSVPVWSNPEDGYIRISKNRTGSYSSAGVVEVYLGSSYMYFSSGSWGTVCYDDFAQGDADSVCRQLGYTGSSNYFSTNFTEAAWLKDLHCGDRGSKCFMNCYDYPTYDSKATVCDNGVATVTCTYNDKDAGLSYGTNLNCVYNYYHFVFPYWGIIITVVFWLAVLAICVVSVIGCCYGLANCPLAASRRRIGYEVVNTY